MLNNVIANESNFINFPAAHIVGQIVDENIQFKYEIPTFLVWMLSIYVSHLLSSVLGFLRAIELDLSLSIWIYSNGNLGHEAKAIPHVDYQNT